MKEFTVVRKGYAPDEVKVYIEELEKALADKSARLKEFQAKEAAITNSMIEAELCSAQIRKQAEKEAEDMRANALNEMDQLREQVLALHNKLTAFQSEYGRILQEYLVSLRSNDLVALFSRLESFMKTIEIKKPAEETVPAQEVAPAVKTVSEDVSEDAPEEAPSEQ